MIKRLLLVCVPVALFLLVSTAILSLSCMDIKYIYEPTLIGTHLDFLVDETYFMVWLLYSASNITFIVIYVTFLLFFKRVSKKDQSVRSQYIAGCYGFALSLHIIKHLIILVLQGMPGTAHKLMGTLSAILLKYEPRLKKIDVVLLEQTVPGELRYAIDAELRGIGLVRYGTEFMPEGRVLIRHLKQQQYLDVQTRL